MTMPNYSHCISLNEEEENLLQELRDKHNISIKDIFTKGMNEAKKEMDKK